MPERTNLRVMPHVSLSLAALTLATGCSPCFPAYGMAQRGQAHSGARNQPVVADDAFRMNSHRLGRSEMDGEHLRDARRCLIRRMPGFPRRAPDNDVGVASPGQFAATASSSPDPLPSRAVGMLSADAVSFFLNSFSSADRPQGSSGCGASVRDGAHPTRVPTLACSCLSVGDCQNASTAFRVHTAEG